MKETIIFACKEPATIGKIVGKVASKGGGETKEEIQAQVKSMVESGELIKSGARRGTRYQADPETCENDLSGNVEDSSQETEKADESATQNESHEPAEELTPQEEQVSDSPKTNLLRSMNRYIDENPESIMEVYDRITDLISQEDRLETWVDTWKFVCICAQELSIHPFDVAECLPRLVQESQVEARWKLYSNEYRVRRQSE
jgi:hypothetical protein